MAAVKKHINIIFLYLLLFFAFLFPKQAYTYNDYGFDFSSEWTWEDLISKTINIDQFAVSSIDKLRKQVTIEEARIIFFELSRLPSLSNINNLPDVIREDREAARIVWEERFKKEFDMYSPDDDFIGLLNTVIKLTKVKASEPGAPSFKQRTYLPQPVKTTPLNIVLRFNYDAASSVLDYYGNSGASVNDAGTILNMDPYKLLFEYQKLSDISYDQLIKMFEYSHVNDPLYNIYKWINPASFRSLGGVSVFYKDYLDVISSVKENEDNMRLAVLERLSAYLPEDISLQSELLLMFGSAEPSWGLKDKLGINLEYPGDDYNYLVNLFVHAVYSQAQNDLQFPLFDMMVTKEDYKLLELMNSIMLHGAANYVGPLGNETRPSNLLEKDFYIFNKTFKALYKSKNKVLADSLIREGFSGAAPFHTMGTQMAYIIETVSGRKALVESVMMGTVYFFKKYISSYHQSEKIRRVFTFPSDMENKVASLSSLIPEDILKYAVVLNRNSKDKSLIENEVKGLFKEFKDDPTHQELLNIIAGKLYLAAGDNAMAKEYFLKSLEKSRLKAKNSALMGDLFSKAQAYDDALIFYNMSIAESPDAFAFERRGIFYYITGDMNGAKQDFEKALSLDPLATTSRRLLSRIN